MKRELWLGLKNLGRLLCAYIKGTGRFYQLQLIFLETT